MREYNEMINSKYNDNKKEFYVYNIFSILREISQPSFSFTKKDTQNLLLALNIIKQSLKRV